MRRARNRWHNVQPRGDARQGAMADNPKGAARTALVTGAGRRIGAALAPAFGRAGYAMVLHANNSRDDAERLASAIMGAGGQAHVVLSEPSHHDPVCGRAAHTVS